MRATARGEYGERACAAKDCIFSCGPDVRRACTGPGVCFGCHSRNGWIQPPLISGGAKGLNPPKPIPASPTFDIV
jgi:hypothetical protein